MEVYPSLGSDTGQSLLVTDFGWGHGCSGTFSHVRGGPEKPGREEEGHRCPEKARLPVVLTHGVPVPSPNLQSDSVNVAMSAFCYLHPKR